MQIVFCQAISIIANTLLLNKNSHTKLQYEQIKKEKQGKSNLETQKSIPYTNTNKITWLEKQITHHQASAPTLTRKHKYKTSLVEALPHEKERYQPLVHVQNPRTSSPMTHMVQGPMAQTWPIPEAD